MLCVNGCKECTGCGTCMEQKPVLHDIDGAPIYEGDAYYNINGEIYSEDTLAEYKEIA